VEIYLFIHTYHSGFVLEGVAEHILPKQELKTKTEDVTGGKPISLIFFHDIHEDTIY
jgi:hypothetical protein